MKNPILVRQGTTYDGKGEKLLTTAIRIATLELGKIVTSKGKVFGIDIDKEMIALGDEEAVKEGMDSYVFNLLFHQS